MSQPLPAASRLTTLPPQAGPPPRMAQGVSPGEGRVPAWTRMKEAMRRLGQPAARPDPSPSRRASWLLSPTPSSVREARRLSRRQLADWALHEPCEVAELLVSELVTNALRHAWGPVRLSLSSQGGTLRCEIEDADPSLPHVCEVKEDDEGGRGLHMLELLSHGWGSHRTNSGKIVWFELPALSPSAGWA